MRRYVRDTDLLIDALPYMIESRLRYCRDLVLPNERTRRADVRRVRHLLPKVKGIGPGALRLIDAWLAAGDAQQQVTTIIADEPFGGA